MLNSERLEIVQTLPLLKGGHAAPDSAIEAKMCVMEAVAFVAGEPWTDKPQCACPVIAEFLRNWNDGITDDATRTLLLKPLIPKLVGSRSTPAVELKRSFMALDWLARVHAPAWLERAGLKGHAELCRELGELHDTASCLAADQVLGAAESAARSAARSAAWSAAWSAVRSALNPTVQALQTSALELVERMLAVGE